MPLFPQIKKQIAYHRLRRGKPVSKFTKLTQKELKSKIPLVHEAKRLMAQQTPCADNATAQNLILDEILEDILLSDSDEYIEYNTSEIDAGEIDAGEIDAGEIDAGEIDAGEIDTDNKQNNGIKKQEKGSSPIHVHLLDNELDFDSTSECNDSSSDTSDTEYKKVLSREDDNNIFQMDEELDIIDSEFQFN